MNNILYFIGGITIFMFASISSDISKMNREFEIINNKLDKETDRNENRFEKLNLKIDNIRNEFIIRK